MEANNYAAAIASAKPTQALMFTAVGNDWHTIRRRMNRVREYLKRRRVAGEWVWHMEANPSGLGNHVHAWRWGPMPITKVTLTACAVSAGLGTTIGVGNVITATGWSSGGLLGAGAMGYPLKAIVREPTGPELTASQAQYLTLNGNRLAHASRDFWRDSLGWRLSGRRAAVREAQMCRRPEEEDRWAMMTRDAAAIVLSLPVASWPADWGL
ncbi:MAG: hypothetical protein QOJ11_3097 [Frankiales bacterium]|nr:hypothetical protein [Frankiales bacterium]